MMTTERRALRQSFRGLSEGARVHVRGTRVRSSMNATVLALMEPDALKVRRDSNGGEYLVRLADVQRLRRAPRVQ